VQLSRHPRVGPTASATGTAPRQRRLPPRSPTSDRQVVGPPVTSMSCSGGVSRSLVTPCSASLSVGLRTGGVRLCDVRQVCAARVDVHDDCSPLPRAGRAERVDADDVLDDVP